jgi:N-acetylated-alpha-linked acidic dipeptidase
LTSPSRSPDNPRFREASFIARTQLMIHQSRQAPRAWVALLALMVLSSALDDLPARARPHTLPAPASEREGSGVPLGFTPQSFEAEQRLEERYLKIPSPPRCRKFLRRLTREPHVAGTAGDRRITEFIYNEFQRDGLNPEIVEYRVLLSYPKRVEVGLVAPVALELAHPEPAIRGDKLTHVADPLATMPWNGYSPSADLTRPVVYANYGTPEDYEQLEKLGVSVRDKIVLVRYFHGYRGGKGLEAEKRGVAGVIVYSDPAEDGSIQGKTYPHGPWGPLGHFQRGAVVYDFLVPGDPLTPGWASTEGARRIPESESTILPKIPMVPMSAADAKEILSRLGGAQAPKEWQGGLGLTYHLGDAGTRVRLVLEMENRVTPIWDVIGRIRGTAEPEKLVVLSNHHDAWVYGAVDPSSGTAAMLETARALGQLVQRGFRPRRTILFGSWDAEEYTLTGSTEWGEQFADDLERNAVVCLNVDAATSGGDFSLAAVPALVPAVIEATEAVRDPRSDQSVYARWSTRRTAADVRSYAVPGATGGPVPFGVLGGGSDFMVFLQHDGVPSLDMIFDGPYGVYHSVYDDFDWMARFGDPGFRYHAAMSRVWGLLALRFANSDVLPLDYSLYATEVGAYLEDLEKIAPPAYFAADIRPLIEKCHVWRDRAARFGDRRVELRRGSSPASMSSSSDGGGGESAATAPAAATAAINAALMAEERALLLPGGIPGRPWFRHLVYAPLPTYDAETLPGLREALVAKDLDRARAQARELGRALDRAIAALDGAR